MSCHTVLQHIVPGQRVPVKSARRPGPPLRCAAATRVPNQIRPSPEHTHHFERVVLACTLERLREELVFTDGSETFPRGGGALTAPSPLDEGDANVQRQVIEIPDATGTGCQRRRRAGLWWMLRAACWSRQEGVHNGSLDDFLRGSAGVRARRRHVEQTREKPSELRRRPVRVTGGWRFRGRSGVTTQVRGGTRMTNGTFGERCGYAATQPEATSSVVTVCAATSESLPISR